MHDTKTNNEWAGIQIRLATAADAPKIETVLSQSFEEYRSRYTEEAFENTAPPTDTILKRMKEGPVWVAVQRGEVVGTISAVPKGRSLLLRGMGVPPAARGRAIGRLLLVHVARFAFQNRFRRMALTTTPFLTRAIRECEQFGFRRSEEGPREVHGTPVYTLTKTL